MILRDPEFPERCYDVPQDLFETATSVRAAHAPNISLVQILFDLSRAFNRPIQMDFGF